MGRWEKSTEGPEISQDQIQEAALKGHEDSRFTGSRNHLKLGILPQLDGNKIKQSYDTSLPEAGCGESCPEAREELGEGGGTTKASKAMLSRASQRRLGASGLKRQEVAL